MAPTSDVERLIRWSLRDAFAGAEPSPEVWSKVLARVSKTRPSQPPAKRRRLTLVPLGSLVQAAIISTLLLAFGLGVDQGVALPGAQYALPSAPPRPRYTTSEVFPTDTLRKYVLLKMEREHVETPQQRGFAAGLDRGW